MRFGTWVLMPLQGAAARHVAMCAFGAWVLVAVCAWSLRFEPVGRRCRVPLQCAANKICLLSGIYAGVFELTITFHLAPSSLIKPRQDEWSRIL